MRDFLEVNSPDAAERAISTLFAALQRLEDFPNLGRPTGDDSIRQRVVPFGSACYVMRYVLGDNGDLLVLRVWHGREART
ncbi:type II toxin-antitoxin system RelE/ParE family toxin [Rhodopseudomonas palustris]|uniref:type II toxin-antitoxin system RelE/ParE family toxin n=1 Tax=Rhodopseudomonas palustris TaxID=1076 RepID=UPI000CEBF2A8|nr:type II toxin-antitoxin system RelE/ParE family toxin [Rhodopseudomonas palustris]PPQ45562.1 plasmid stabilization protein [Rhodopseudomonas palustris]